MGWFQDRKDRLVKTKVAGVASSVQRGQVVITTPDGEITHNNLRKTFVQPGEHVAAGRVIGRR